MTQHTQRRGRRRAAGAALVGAGVATLLGWGVPSAAAGSWVAPVPLAVADRFDPPGQRWLAGHRGVDLLAAVGAVVRAAGAGRVSYAGPLAGRGVVVVVHGTVRTTYEPVTATVSVGDRVAAGQPIGVLEPGVVHCDGRSCLHWGLLRGDGYLDPLTLLGATRVRLLPFSADRPSGGWAAVGARPSGWAVAGSAPATQAGSSGGSAAAAPSRPAGRPAVAPLLVGAAAVLGVGSVGLAQRRRAPP